MTNHTNSVLAPNVVLQRHSKSKNSKSDFAGRVAVITGGAGGIGRAICQQFIQRHIHCILVDIDEPRLIRACRDFGPLTSWFQADLTERNSVEQLVKFVESSTGRLDILVNNAAITNTERFEERSVDSIVDEMDINLISPLVVTRLLMPLLRRSGDGRIISTVSLGGIFPLPETTIYSASKFGLRGAMLCLGLDGERLGIHVGSVLPSATETPMLMREAMEGGNTLQFMDPPQQPEDVARQVVRMLDDPRLERYPRLSESWTVRLSMLNPNLLLRVIPLLRKKGEQGHQRYLQSLRDRGFVQDKDGKTILNVP